MPVEFPSSMPDTLPPPDMTFEDVETLLRDAHALAVALSELSEDGRTTDGHALVCLIRPKLAAAKAPLARWEATFAGAAQVDYAGLRRLYDAAKAIADADDEADTYAARIFCPLTVLTRQRVCRPTSDSGGARPRKQSIVERVAGIFPGKEPDDTAVPGLQSESMGMSFSSAVGLIAVGTMIYVTLSGRRR
jgi:hypothetical protein